MRLNVGCGADAWGDVRIDISRNQWWANSVFFKKKPAANILADTTYLPFRDKVFQYTKAFQVLEHVPNYKLALQEIKRVTQSKIELMFPIDSSVPHTIIYRLLEFSLFNIVYIFHLPSMTKEHLWQIDPEKIAHYLTNAGFKVRIEKKTYAVFGFLSFGRKAKYFTYTTNRFRKAHSWKIIAFRL